MSTTTVPAKLAPSLHTLLVAAPFNATSRSIQYGIQYQIEGGIVCNIHHSDKRRDIVKITLQNVDANQEIAAQLRFFIENLANGTQQEGP
ncbi:TPA: hypothetical protein QEL58_001044 [Stenotrophomonas maltophilia]|nr:hypothetical protein [Stenotrophomonas maltophilia]